MFNYYNEEEIEILREGGRRLEQIMRDLESFVVVGTVVADIDKKCLELIASSDAKPATVGYKPRGAPFPFPSSVCVSINNGIAHGISTNNQRIIESGDIVSADVVIQYKGLFVDTCRSWGVGEMSEQDKLLITAARKTTNAAVKKAVLGNTTNDIGKASEETAKKYNFQTVKELGGHGVGRKIHDHPFIPSFANSGYNDKLKEGMLLAIEPIVNAGSWEMMDGDDGYLYVTKDGKKSAQFEETVLITKDGPEILTKI
jgi:methionyl aminopeptidase